MTETRKIAIITGTSSGIGLLTAVEMAGAGYHVIATMRDPAKKDRLMAAAEKAGISQNIEVRALDVTRFEELPSIVEGIARDHGRIDVLVNNAGYALAGFAEDILLEELKAQLDTNFFGQVAVTKAVLPVMRRQGSGHIIMVSSISGLVSFPITSSYSSSKFALEAWSESLRIELHSLGIRVVLIEPGAFDTDIWETNVRLGKRAMSPESSYFERARRYTERVKQERGRRADPRRVAQLIVRVAGMANPNLRYRIGSDAAFLYWMRRLVPWRRYERMIAKGTQID
ncbi:MAG: SDR family oxidoreductase [Acidobacteriales bacterium]|nr:SDR family oxidoreductase [Terriglobales bacterium]